MSTIKVQPQKSYTVGDLSILRAKQRGVDTSRAAKEVRGILRANWSVVTALDPSIVKAKSAANDQNRWPAMNAKVATFVLDRTKRDGLRSEATTKAKRSTRKRTTAKPAAKVTNDGE